MADIPDFDSMSPEEVMAWMESLAKRQGATEGFTTAADLEINEVDPSTIQLDEPGYVPFGEEDRRPAQPKKPVEQAPPPPPAPRAETPPLPTFEDEGEQDTETSPTAEIRGMAWLETLAADQGGDFPEIDLSSLSAELESADTPEAEDAGTNPVEWLESISAGEDDEEAFDFDDEVLQLGSFEDDEEEVFEDFGDEEYEDFEEDEEEAETLADLSGIDDPLAAGVDPMAWLESLARRQGAKDEELTTRATSNSTPRTPQRQPEPLLEDDEPETASIDPAAWLESLAAEEEITLDAELEAEMSDEDIQQALAGGVEIPRDEMAAFLDRQLKRQLEGGEIPQGEYDPDAPAEKAELPDWLLESVQPPAELEDEEESEPLASFSPALLDEIVEPPDIPDLPDWLREDTDVMPELEDIFATEDLSESQEEEPETEEAADLAPAAMLDIDTDDPWVVAFDEETETDPDVIPDWYQQNVNDPERIAQVERQTGSQNDELQEVDLEPETELEAGELEPAVPDWLNLEEAEVEPAEVPDWLSAEVTVSETGATPTGTDVPEWLQDADVSIDSGDIPDWLRETVEEEQAEATPASEIAATVETPAPAPEVASPAPVPVTAAIDVEATLAQARKQIDENNLDGGLIEYESIIRANKALDAVVSDLTKLIDEHDDNPAVYRVLGDGYMRQGKLQSALDTYRKALNQL